MNRYLRHELIDWFSQEAVSRKRICVVGAGAVGNEVIKNLVLFGVGEIEIVDFDLVEIHNLTRSVLFREGDVGRPKAEIAAFRAKELDPNVAISYRHENIKQCLTPYRLKSFDCLIGCVDNFEARIYMNAIARLARIDFINLGIDSRHALAESYPFSADSTVACYECGLPPSVYERMSQRYSCGYLKKIAFEERKIPTTIVTSAISGALAASIALRLGEKRHEVASSRVLIDTIRGSSTVTSDLAIGRECPVCTRSSAGAALIAASRRQSSALVFSGSNEQDQLKDVVVVLSEPVVVSARCTKCGTEPYDGKLRLRAASELDEAARFCSCCLDSSVDIEFVEECSLAAFERHFGDALMPIPFVTLLTKSNTVCISFEE